MKRRLAAVVRVAGAICGMVAGSMLQAQEKTEPAPAPLVLLEDGPLFTSLLEGDAERFFRLLDESGIDVNQPLAIAHANAPTRTVPLHLLHQACWAGHRSIVMELLRRGADPMQRDELLQLPIEEALKKGHEEVVALLEQHSLASASGEFGVEEMIPLILRQWAGDTRYRMVYFNGWPSDEERIEKLRALGLRITLDPKDPPLEVTYSKPSPDRIEYEVSFHPGPLSGGFETGAFVYRRGYWILTDHVPGVY